MPALRPVLSIAAFAAFTLSGSAATLRVPQDHPTIQAAVDAANPGDTIVVKKGTYTENLVVDVPGLTIIGKMKVVIDGGGANTGIHVDTVEGVTLKNLRIVNTNTGIVLDQANDCVVTGCQVSKSIFGVFTNSADRNLIEKVTIKDTGGFGISLSFTSNQNLITQCKLTATSGVTFDGNFNVIQDCAIEGGGVDVASGTGHVVAGNTIRSATRGVRLLTGFGPTYVLDNAVSDCENGIVLDSIDGQVVQGNSIKKSSQSGIVCDESGSQLIANNVIRKSALAGIDLFDSDDNVIQGNDVKKSGADGMFIGGDDNLVSGNKVAKSADLDIEQALGATGNTFIGNDILTSNL